MNAEDIQKLVDKYGQAFVQNVVGPIWEAQLRQQYVVAVSRSVNEEAK